MINITLDQFKAGIHAKVLFLKERRKGRKLDIAIPALMSKPQKVFDIEEDRSSVFDGKLDE